MLSGLIIQNIALIDRVEISLGEGFNVITGETGAGKSILVDALGLLLGARADKELVRIGTAKACVEGIFLLSGKDNIQVCKEFGIEIEDEMLIIRREITADGKSMIRINGHAVTLSQLRAISMNLVDIHGQNEHQMLLITENHLQMLDRYAEDMLAEIKNDVKGAYETFRNVLKLRNEDWGNEEQRARKMDILRFQIDEIIDAAIYAGEKEELELEKKRLLSAESVREALESAHEALQPDGGAADGIGEALNALRRLVRIDEDYEELLSRLESAYYEIADVSQECADNAESLDADPQRLDQIEERLETIKNLCRKYGPTAEDVDAFLKKAQHELEFLENCDERMQKIEQDYQQSRLHLYRKSKRLSELRRKAAAIFEEEISMQLAELGMKNAKFSVSFSPLQEEEQADFTVNGIDKCEFLFSANLGQPLKPLSKIISGGEMSRFMLGVKTVMAGRDFVPTMVFDEIDTGISGRMAQITAEKMSNIAKEHQVLCVTHLPQIAAMADRHFYIEKCIEDGNTKTHILEVNGNRRAEELARLVGGETSRYALQHAEDMIAYAQAYKKKV